MTKQPFTVSKCFLVLGSLINAWLLSFGVSAQTVFSFSTMQDSLDSQVAEVIVRQAYGSLNFDVKVTSLPAIRAIRSSNMGQFDGELLRSRETPNRAPNLIRIEVPIHQVKIVAATKLISFKVNGWESLRPFKVGIVRGGGPYEQGTRDMDRYFTTDYKQLLTMLDKGRLDIIATSLLSLKKAMKETHTRGIRILSPAIIEIPTYHFIHDKHALLVPKITQALKDALNDKDTLKTISQLSQ